MKSTTNKVLFNVKPILTLSSNITFFVIVRPPNLFRRVQLGNCPPLTTHLSHSQSKANLDWAVVDKLVSCTCFNLLIPSHAASIIRINVIVVPQKHLFQFWACQSDSLLELASEYIVWHYCSQIPGTYCFNHETKDANSHVSTQQT